MSMLDRLVAMVTKTLSGRSGTGSSPSTAPGQRSNGNEMAQQVGRHVIEQVRRAGPDAAQRQLGKTRYAHDPRARKAAKAADDLTRRFAGTAEPPPATPPEKERPVNRYGERP